MPIFTKNKNVPIVLLEYINLFQSKWQHETNIWEELICPLPYYIAMFHFKHNYCNQLSTFCLNLCLLCQHFALCFCLPIIPIFCQQNRRIPTRVGLIIKKHAWICAYYANILLCTFAFLLFQYFASKIDAFLQGWDS